MIIGGLEPLTLIDFPGKVAAIAFTAGCNMRCGYCYNWDLVLPEKIQQNKNISEDDFYAFLETRQGLLDGVVISGGEPTVHPDLEDFILNIRDLGFDIKLDTNGTHPEVLQHLLKEKLLDYVAIDIKAAPDKYTELTHLEGAFKKIKQSISLLKKSGIPYEFRTTYIKGFHDESDVEAITQICEGCPQYTIQNFQRTQTLDPKFEQYTGFSTSERQHFKNIAQKHIENVVIL